MKTSPLLTSAFLALSLAMPSAFAADKTWDGGGGDNNWLTGANWDANTAPVATDSLFFGGSTRTSNTNDFAALTQFNGLTLNSGANSFTLAGNAITLGGNITTSSSNAQNVNLATVLAGNIAVNVNSTGSVNLNGAITGNQTITINGGSGTVGTYLAGASRNSFLGTFQVNSLLFSGTGMNVSGATVNLGSAGTLDMRGVGANVAGINGLAGSTVTTGSGTRTLTVAGSGNYNFAGNIVNGSGTTELWVTMNYGAGKGGSQTLSGNNTFTGRTFVDSGRLVLDYSTNNTSKLSDTGLLTFRAGTIELVGGSHVEAVGNLTVSGSSTPAGMLNFVRSSGNSTLQLGAIGYSDFTTGGGGAINFSTSGMATTTTGVVNGLLSPANGSARITIGGVDWATKSGDDIVAFNSYSTFVQSGGTSTLNYLLNGGSSLTGNVTFNTLKIASSTGSAQTLALGNRTLGLGRNGLLITGTDDYAITAAAGFGLGGTVIHNYSTGNLTLGPTTSILEHYGTGKTILTAASSATTSNSSVGLRMGSGTLQFSDNNQLSGNGSLILFGGRFVADTTSGNISLTNNAAGRSILLGSDVPVIDVIGGGSLTIGGVISSAFGNPNQYISSVVFGSSETNGTFILTGNNTFNGDTRLAGGKLSVNSATSLGANATIYKFIFSGNSTLNTTANIATARYYDINSGVTGTIETDGSTTLTHSGTIAGAGNLRKAGAGTLTISGTSTYTGNTTISAGTLLLDATGTIASSPVINLGTAGSQGTLDVTAKSAFTIGAGQTLAGYGLVNIGTGKTVTIAGNLAPGNSPGITSVTGSLALLSSTVTTMELGGLAAGTGFDQVVVSEAMTYDGTLTIVSFGGWNINQVASYNLFDFASQTGNFDTVTVGGFGLTWDSANTYTGTNGGTTYTFTLNDGVLAVVPEPSSWMLLAAAATFFLVMRRRRI